MAYEKIPVESGEVISSDWGNHIQTQYDEVIRNVPSIISDTVNGGEVEEQGENENGEYVRYSNGVQICWGYLEGYELPSINISSGALYRTESYRWTYPSTFATTENLTLSGSSQALNWWIIRTGIGNVHDVPLRTFGAVSSSGSYRANFFAIGRWK